MKNKSQKKINNTMKYFVSFRLLALLFSFLFSSFAFSAAAQDAKITLSIKDKPLKEVLNAIEAKSGYSYLVRSNDVNLNEIVSIDAENKSVREVLVQLFKKSQIDFEIKGKSISIFKPQTRQNETSTTKQVRKINGVVTDKNGEPIIGASIMVKGSKLGTITNVDGQFSIEVPNQSVLIVSYIGYAPLNIVVENQKNLVVKMAEDSKALDEVVVVAFGTQTKQTMTSSVSQVSSKVLENRPTTNVLAGLQGQVAGVNITQSNGQPGQSATISIRGTGSINSGTAPLVIVDGIPGSMSMVSSDDVESVSVLKDAAACSMYGARAANGVVLITTKKGKLGKVSVSYSGYVGSQKPTELFQEADAYSYANAYNTAKMADAITPANTVYDPTKKVFTQAQLDGWKSGAVPSADWRGSLFSESGFTQSHSVNVAGGVSAEKVSIKNNLSFNYLQQKGNLVNTNYNHYGVRENGEVKWGKFTSGFTVGLSNAQTDAPVSFIGDLGGIIGAVNRQRSVDPIKVFGDWNTAGTKDTRNPVRQALEGGTSKTNLYNALANVNLAYEFIPGLVAKFTNGINYNNSSKDDFINSLLWVTAHDANGKATMTDLTGPNSDTRTNYQDIHYLQQFDVNYRKSFGDHNLAVLVGGQQEFHTYNELGAKRSNFILNTSPSLQLGSADGATNSSVYYDWGIMGVFGRVNYDYNKKYLFEVNFREDGSSRLSPGKNWDFFPSFSAGWRITEEPFMKALKPVLSEMKLRASYGVLGNQNIPGANNNQYFYPYQAIIGPAAYTYYTFGGTMNNPMTVTQSPNNTFTWERTALTDLAVDGNLWKGLVTYSLGYFNKRTENMLMMTPVASTNGASSFVANVGSMRNYGFEFELGFNKTTTSGITISTNANLTYMTNELTDLGGKDLAASGVYRNMVGYPLNSYYIYQNDGYLTKAEFQNPATKLLKGQKWGDQKIKDVSGPNGVPDGIITADDRVNTGKSSIPKWLFGFNFDVSYKGFGVAGMLQGAADYYKYLGGSVGYGFNSGYSTTQWTIDNSYNPLVDENNYNTRLPRLSTTNTINNNYPSDKFLFNCTYVRLKNLQFYYNLPTQVCNMIKVSNVKIYFSGQNLFTLSALPKALGVDPEIGSATGGYPLVRIATLGLNVKF
jgi:TonB-linked SusC/RagA family outer membrane protein